MGAVTHTQPRPHVALAGTGELPLTRAIIRYHGANELDGGALEDVGVGVVVDGEYAASADVLDLGSGRLRHLDLGAELVILDWVYASTIEYVRMLMRAPRDPAAGVPGPLLQYCQGILVSVLRRTGVDPLSRPALLRVGFRDVARDLDPHERTAVRITVGDDVLSVRLDADDNALLAAMRYGGADRIVEETLLAAFPEADVRRLRDRPATYQLRFPLPFDLGETRALVSAMREGILALYARHEPERHAVLHAHLDVFGVRDTLAQLSPWDPAPAPVRLRASSPARTGAA